MSPKNPNRCCAPNFSRRSKKIALPVIGEIRAFKDIFALLLQTTREKTLTLIVDEFQEFATINPAIFSEIQNLWDREKNGSRLNAVFIGSIHAMMIRIFQNAKEPLFDRADRMIWLQPFDIPTLAAILRDYEIRDLQTLFDFYVFTGGMPKYIDAFISNGCTSFRTLLDFMVQQNSPLIDEGRNLLIEEFGRDYGSYWERGGQNEIDLVAIDERQRKLVVAEIKLNKNKINLNVLQQKATRLLASWPEYTPSFLGLSLEDAKAYLP